MFINVSLCVLTAGVIFFLLIKFLVDCAYFYPIKVDSVPAPLLCPFPSLQAEGNAEKTLRAWVQTTCVLMGQEKSSGPGYLGLRLNSSYQ